VGKVRAMKILPAWVWLMGLGLVGSVGAEEEAPAEAEIEAREEMQASADKGARRNITLGAMFREEFKQQEGVQKLKNGILYKIHATGKGKTPKTTDFVKVKYEGRHVDGRIFDDYYKEEPARFRSDRNIIMGWQEVLPRMREGDKWEIVIPSHLAYAATGKYGKDDKSIGANETLVFTIELVEVEDPMKKAKGK
jgi:FKBP-type peptidyl-prolyl cis-trans isomerase FklB